MSRSLGLLSVLIGIGTVGGYYVHQASKTPPIAAASSAKPVAPAMSKTPSVDDVLPLPVDSSPLEAAQANSPLSATEDRQIQILQSQVEYLEEQNKILLKENSELIDKLATLTSKPKPPTPKVAENCEPEKNLPAMDDEVGPDFVGVSIELLKIRELQELPVPTVEASPAEVTAKIYQWLKSHVPGEFGVNQGRALTALGAIPMAVDTTKMKASFWAYQIGAWYDEASQTVYMTKKGESLGPNLENALGLSYTYLLKHFGTTLFKNDPQKLTVDERLAKDSVIAGDASLMRFLHALKNPQTGGGGGVGEDPDDPSREVPIPNFLRELELQPFQAGFDFMQAMHSIGGWDQVNAVYKRPPVTSAELLDTTVYLQENQFTPMPIDTTDAAILGDKPFWSETLGPIGINLFLRSHVPMPIASDVMLGWANDVVLTYPSKEAAGDHSVWLSRWKTTDGADAFFNAMRDYLKSKHREAAFVAGTPQGVIQMNLRGQFVHLQRTHQGQGILLIQSTSDSFRQAAIQKYATP